MSSLYVPIFIGGGEDLRVEQRGPVRGEKKHSVSVFLRSQKKWKIALSKCTLSIETGTVRVTARYCTVQVP